MLCAKGVKRFNKMAVLLINIKYLAVYAFESDDSKQLYSVYTYINTKTHRVEELMK